MRPALSRPLDWMASTTYVTCHDVMMPALEVTLAVALVLTLVVALLITTANHN